MPEATRNPLPELPPLKPEEVTAYSRLAKNPVAYFLDAEKRGIPLHLDKILQTLAQFRTRVSIPTKEKGGLQLKKSDVDADLIQFAAGVNADPRHYEGLFKVIRRLGFATTDCIQILMQQISLEHNSPDDLAQWTAILAAAQKTVDALPGLPPVTRRATTSERPAQN